MIMAPSEYSVDYGNHAHLSEMNLKPEVHSAMLSYAGNVSEYKYQNEAKMYNQWLDYCMKTWRKIRSLF